MINLALTTLALTLSLSAAAAPWDKTDKTLFAGFTSARVADMAQTLQIARRPTGIESGYVYTETNPLIGASPSVGRVLTYFAVSHALVWLVADHLPAKTRKAFLTGAVVISAQFVQRNAELGINVRF